MPEYNPSASASTCNAAWLTPRASLVRASSRARLSGQWLIPPQSSEAWGLALPWPQSVAQALRLVPQWLAVPPLVVLSRTSQPKR